jgi:DNA ligase D-like protein (predicted 3'-phosphoesterase)
MSGEAPRRRDPLKAYREKRDFRRTPEPSEKARSAAGRRSGREPLFVVQKHQATALHYDFRLEVRGVLKSWAVPKGPSLDPRQKRLAMPTEDHPMGYANFEGVIPEGEYGAGPVIVWDRGTWRNLTERDGEPLEPEAALEAGHLKLWLEGEKLRGGFTLQRIGTDGRSRWLLIKLRDEGADARKKPVRSRPESVISGRTLEELETAEG